MTHLFGDAYKNTHCCLYRERYAHLLIFRRINTCADIKWTNTVADIQNDTHFLIQRKSHVTDDIQSDTHS